MYGSVSLPVTFGMANIPACRQIISPSSCVPLIVILKVNVLCNLQTQQWAMRVTCLSSVSVTFGMASTTMYYYTKVMSDLFLDSSSTGGKSFRAITSVDDFWKVKYYSFSSLLATSGMPVPQLTDLVSSKWTFPFGTSGHFWIFSRRVHITPKKIPIRYR